MQKAVLFCNSFVVHYFLLTGNEAFQNEDGQIFYGLNKRQAVPTE